MQEQLHVSSGIQVSITFSFVAPQSYYPSAFSMLYVYELKNTFNPKLRLIMPQSKHNIEYRKSFNLIILQILTPYANMNTF